MKKSSKKALKELLTNHNPKTLAQDLELMYDMFREKMDGEGQAAPLSVHYSFKALYRFLRNAKESL